MILSFILSLALAAGQALQINEICWTGTELSFSDEWIELYNPAQKSLSLEGWTLEAADGSPSITLEGRIGPESFFLLERTDDSTVPGKKADQIYKGALSNKGERLELKDKTGALVDSVDCSGGWLAGNNELKLTMERTKSLFWQESLSPGGTPGLKNSERREAPALPESGPPERSDAGKTALFLALFSAFLAVILKKAADKRYNKKI